MFLCLFLQSLQGGLLVMAVLISVFCAFWGCIPLNFGKWSTAVFHGVLQLPASRKGVWPIWVQGNRVVQILLCPWGPWGLGEGDSDSVDLERNLSVCLSRERSSGTDAVVQVCPKDLSKELLLQNKRPFKQGPSRITRLSRQEQDMWLNSISGPGPRACPSST